MNRVLNTKEMLDLIDRIKEAIEPIVREEVEKEDFDISQMTYCSFEAAEELSLRLNRERNRRESKLDND